MSVVHHTRIERGGFSGISDSVLDGFAHACVSTTTVGGTDSRNRKPAC